MEPGGIQRLPSPPALGRVASSQPRRRGRDGRRFDEALREAGAAEAAESAAAADAPEPRPLRGRDAGGEPGQHVDVVV